MARTRAADARREQLLSGLPDAPWLVGARALLREHACDVVEAEPPGTGACLVQAEGDLVIVLGEPGAAAVRRAVDGLGAGVELLARASARAQLDAALPSWNAERALLATGSRLRLDDGLRRRALASGAELRVHGAGPCADADAGPLPLAHVDGELAGWLGRMLRRAAVAAAWLDGRPVAFACAAWSTEGLWDVSVDTLPSARRRGLAAWAASELGERLTARGLAPVWGAVESNAASLALGARLGLRRSDELLVYTRAG